MPTIVAVLDDLFFNVKIADAGKRAGLDVRFVTTEAALFDRLGQGTALVVVDLNCASLDPVSMVARVKAEFPATRVIGFVSHVQTELRERARHAGCDAVVARSVFSTRLPELLREHSEGQPKL